MDHLGRRIRWWHISFKVNPRKGQFQVKLGQISKFIFFCKNMPIFCSFVSGFQKFHLFVCKPIKNVQNCVSKMWRHHLYLFFFYNCTAKKKTKILLWNCIYMLFVYILITCVPFIWITWKFWILLAIIFGKNRNFEFWG